jgi:hypothetical protein
MTSNFMSDNLDPSMLGRGFVDGQLDMGEAEDPSGGRSPVRVLRQALH